VFLHSFSVSRANSGRPSNDLLPCVRYDVIGCSQLVVETLNLVRVCRLVLHMNADYTLIKN